MTTQTFIQPKKILAIKLRAIGDTVIWTSPLNALRTTYPNSQIDILTYQSNRPAVENNPNINQIYTLANNSAVNLISKLWSLRSKKYDLVIGFHAADTLSRWIFLLNSPNVILHHHSRFQKPYWATHPVEEPGTLEDAISRDYRTLAATGNTFQKQPTRIFISPKEISWAHKTIASEKEKLGITNNKPIYFFLPGASHHLRRYPKDLWIPQLEKVLSSEHYLPVVACDKSLSKEWILEKLCSNLKIPLFDQLNLREFIALLSVGERALANDSGPGHIAVAVGLQTTFLFGPGCVGDWHCYDKNLHPLIRTAVSCRNSGPRDREQFQYCAVDQCSHHSCMRNLSFSME